VILIAIGLLFVLRNFPIIPNEQAKDISVLSKIGEVPVISYNNEEDGNLHFDTIIGQGKPIVLNFWAALCPSCRAEMLEFQEIHENFGDQIVLFAVDIGPFTGLGTVVQGRDLVEDLKVTYPVGTTEDTAIINLLQISAVPTTLFATSKGIVRKKFTGFLSAEEINNIVEELLEET